VKSGTESCKYAQRPSTALSTSPTSKQAERQAKLNHDPRKGKGRYLATSQSTYASHAVAGEKVPERTRGQLALTGVSRLISRAIGANLPRHLWVPRVALGRANCWDSKRGELKPAGRWAQATPPSRQSRSTEVREKMISKGRADCRARATWVSNVGVEGEEPGQRTT